MVNYARTRMLINKRRFSKNLLIDSFGGGTLSTGTGRIAVVFYLLNFEVNEMTPFKSEETLHEYLRRYLDRISKSKARGLAEQKDVPELQLVTGFPEWMSSVKE